MKLKSVQIADYKCIRKPCRLDVADITCLVGKNESGKTAILEALYRLNPVVARHGIFDVDEDFPRIDVEDYRLDVAERRRDPAIVTRANFVLEPEDLKELEADFPRIVASPELVLSKGYANELYAELTINDEGVVGALLAKAQFPPQQLKALVRCSTLQDLAAALRGFEKTDSARNLLESIDAITEKGLLRYLYERYIEARVPKFLYFDEFYQMKGHVNIQALLERKQADRLLESDYPLLGLIDLARLNLEEISNPRRALERDNRLEGASNHLTRSIMKYWSQNRHLEMRFDIRPGLHDDPEGMQSGVNLWGHVYNARQKVTTLLGRRSRGFVWFFSFLAWFTQQKRKGTPLILLLDEPSLFLHATAQADLLRFLEDEGTTGVQVIYSTQSPYLVDARRLDRVRVVEDRSSETESFDPAAREGTQVYADFTQADRESIVPLEGALEHDLSRELFPGGNLLVVEGVHDLLYLHTMSSLLAADGKAGLDPRWTVAPLGGSRRLAAFFALAGQTKDRNWACLLDLEADAEARALLRQDRIVAYSDFCEIPQADIEDLFDPEFYLSLVNSAFGEAAKISLSKGQLRGRSQRIVELVSAHLGSAFSRLKPAQYFAEQASALKADISEAARLRFEKMFGILNSVAK